MNIEVLALESDSVIEMARAAGRQVRSIRPWLATPALEIVRSANVAYVPSALDTGQSLQVVDGRYMPMEAVFDTFTVDFVKPRIAAKGASFLEGFAESSHDGDVCILGNVFSRNFTHWHEELMKVIVLEQAESQCAYVISKLPAFARDLLGIMGISADRILEVTSPTLFRSALYSTPVSYRNVAEYPGVLLALRARLLAGSGNEQSSGTRKLWLDRGKQTRLGRKLVNEEEVHALLDKYDFERLDMGALPVREQISIASSASACSGLHGSQFVHTQLMAPHSRVIECFSPLYLNPTYTEIYRILCHRYSQITATHTPLMPYEHGADVMVDCQQLDLALRGCSG
jgi:hypothetical protein